MKVFLICQNDWANVAYGYQESLKALGVDATAGIFQKHVFDYPNQAQTIDAPKLVKLSDEADCIIFMHSQPVNIPVGPFKLRKKKLIVFHGGSEYRNNPHEVATVFRDIGCKTAIIQNFDLMGLHGYGDINEIPVMPAIDTDYIRPDNYEVEKKLVIAHYPRGYEKGTNEIRQIMKKYDGIVEFRCGNPEIPVSWEDNIERMKECDIYITAIPHGRVTGIGVSAMEAAALGKIVILPCIDKMRYKVYFGEEFFYVANNKEQLKGVIDFLICKKPEELVKLKKQSRERVIAAHSYESTGRMLLDIIENVRHA